MSTQLEPSKKYEKIVVDQLYWVHCKKCGRNWQSFILEWVKEPTCKDCQNLRTTLGELVTDKNRNFPLHPSFWTREKSG